MRTRVFLEHVSSYDIKKIKDKLHFISTQADLWKRIHSKSTILIKPNLLGAYTPEKAVTTHPAVIEAFVQLLLDHGKTVWIGDSPGGIVNSKLVWEKTGLLTIQKKYDCKIFDFGKEGIQNKNFLKLTIPIDKHVLDADAIINIAKYKTHSLLLYTGAIKNLFGVVPGLKKSDFHKQSPDPDDFARIICSIYEILKDKIALNVIDGIVGMEGEGPSAGKPRAFEMLFAGEYASAVDIIAAQMMGFKPNDVEYIQQCLRTDQLDYDEIEYPEEYHGFVFAKINTGPVLRRQRLIKTVPKFLQSAFTRLFDCYPDFLPSCKLCRICEKSCPVNAITISAHDTTPNIDRNTCIKCMCCHEFCPHHAIFIKKSPLAKLFIRP